MKYIHILIKSVDCETVHGFATVLDECLNLESHNPIEYSSMITEEEIADVAVPNVNTYKMYSEHIGGGGLKKPRS